MTTAVICLFIVLLVAWFSAQGLFSSFLHLVLTVLAGCLALALWEPIVYGQLLGRMPEYAWGAGLLLPFGLILLVLRWTFDHYIPGNVSFHPLADRIGGGFFGLLSGVLTAGMLVIGLQMVTFIGVQAPLSYQGWTIDDKGEAEKVGTIFPSVDTMTAGFFDRLSGGSMSAITGKATLADYHPNLAAEASLYNQPAFPDGTRRAVVNGAASLERDENGDVTQYCRIEGVTPLKFEEDAPVTAEQQLVIVPVRVAVQSNDQAYGSGDEDGIYRVTRNQMPLAASSPLTGDITLHYPIGYIHLGEYVPLNVVGEYAFSRAGVTETLHYWVYRIPIKDTPEYIRVKGVRLELPDPAKAQTDPAIATGLRPYEKPEVAVTDPDDPDGENGGETTDGDWKYRVSDSLPFVVNKNRIANSFKMVQNSIASGNGVLRRPDRSEGRIQRNLAVNTIHHAPGAQIVQVNLGTRKTAGSLLGKVMEKAKLVTQAPVLKDKHGATFFPIGHGIITGIEIKLSIDPSNVIRSLSQIDLGSLGDESKVILYFQVPTQTELTEFTAAGESETFDPPLVVP